LSLVKMTSVSRSAFARFSAASTRPMPASMLRIIEP
jgi:hypothetical protein